MLSYHVRVKTKLGCVGYYISYSDRETTSLCAMPHFAGPIHFIRSTDPTRVTLPVNRLLCNGSMLWTMCATGEFQQHFSFTYQNTNVTMEYIYNMIQCNSVIVAQLIRTNHWRMNTMIM